MGCLPSSAFFYIIELDASSTIMVETMTEKNISSFFFLLFGKNSMNLAQRFRYSHAPTIKPLEFEFSPLEKDMYPFAHEWFL